MEDLIIEFTKCLRTMSHSRAGWDYELPREEKYGVHFNHKINMWFAHKEFPGCQSNNLPVFRTEDLALEAIRRMGEKMGDLL